MFVFILSSLLVFIILVFISPSFSAGGLSASGFWGYGYLGFSFWEKIGRRFLKKSFFKSKLFGLNLMILYNLVQEIRNRNIKMYCLSGMKFSSHFNAKQNFINKQYENGIELVSAGSQQLKLDGIKIISKANNCSLDEILFIEDLENTVIYLEENGINAINVN